MTSISKNIIFLYKVSFREEEFEMNKEFDNQLFECSFLIVTMLLKQYKQNSISATEFKTHTKNKLKFLQSSLMTLEDGKMRKDIEQTINECITINNSL